MQSSIKFIFATILLDSLGIGIIIPVLPDVIRRFITDPSTINQYYGYFVSVYALMQLVASPILGSLSDRFGRRPVLLVSLLGAGIDYIIMAFAPNLAILFLGRVFAGLTGASQTVAGSYMADISDDSNRSKNFGIIGAAWGIGFIVGPMLGGFMGTLGPQAPFLMAAGLNLLNFFFGFFILPESLPADKRRNIDIRRLNPFKSIAQILKPSPILALVGIHFLLFLAGQVHPSVWVLFTQYRFQWTPLQVGFSLTLVGITMALVQGFLTGKIMSKYGEEKTLLWCIWIQAISFFVYVVATQSWMIYAILLIGSIGWLSGPALQSLLTKNTPSSEQGELQGSLMSIASLTSIVGPLIYTNLFSWFTNPEHPVHLPGAPYLFASLVCVLAGSMFYIFEKKKTQ